MRCSYDLFISQPSLEPDFPLPLLHFLGAHGAWYSEGTLVEGCSHLGWAWSSLLHRPSGNGGDTGLLAATGPERTRKNHAGRETGMFEYRNSLGTNKRK